MVLSEDILSAAEVATYSEVFNTTAKGALTIPESKLKEALKAASVSFNEQSLSAAKVSANALLDEEIYLPTFLSIVAYLLYANIKESICELFAIFDKSNTGRIPYTDLLFVLNTNEALKSPVFKANVQALVQSCIVSENPKQIDYRKFVGMMTRF